MSEQLELSRSEKILLTLFKTANKGKKSIRFEDIVIALFKAYPKDFHLRGYENYPDSGDMVHKPLYEFRKKGFVEAGNKMFALTNLGLEMAKKIEDATKNKIVKESSGRLTYTIEKELKRISRLEPLRLFDAGKLDKILDTDFYDYLDVTVRTNRSDFIGRLTTLNLVIHELQRIDNDKYKVLVAFHQFMLNKFKDTINYFSTH